MDAMRTVELEPPRFERGPERKIAGFGEHYHHGAIEGIPGLWYRFGPHIGKVPHQVGSVTYGVSSDVDETGFDYLAGVEVASLAGLDESFRTLTLPATEYAVFTHRGHASGIHQTCEAIWGKWLPESGRQFSQAPLFERYGEDFDPATSSGVVEIWCPLQA
jgi:AraC family transcriptional regulator